MSLTTYSFCSVLKLLLCLVPDDFRFSVKMNRLITHTRGLVEWRAYF